MGAALQGGFRGPCFPHPTWWGTPERSRRPGGHARDPTRGVRMSLHDLCVLRRRRFLPARCVWGFLPVGLPLTRGGHVNVHGVNPGGCRGRAGMTGDFHCSVLKRQGQADLLPLVAVVDPATVCTLLRHDSAAGRPAAGAVRAPFPRGADGGGAQSSSVSAGGKIVFSSRTSSMRVQRSACSSG